MKYVKIELQYHDIDEFSDILELPSTQIEEIIDKGTSFLTDTQYLSREVHLKVDTLRLVAKLLDNQVDRKIIRKIVKGISRNNMKDLLDRLYVERDIDAYQHEDFLSLLK